MNWVAMFPGQGSQEPGMGSELLDKYSDYLNEEFKNTLGWSISEIVQVEDKEKIKKTNIAQPYIFAISYCYGLETIKKLGNPKVGIGHSLGEYTALVLGGYMSFKDALKVISVRGEAMQKAVERSNTSMAAVITSDMSSTISSIQKLNEQGIDINISNYNDASQIVISGLIEDLNYLKSNPRDLDAKRVIPLDVAGAFHSPTVTPAKNALETVLKDIEINTGAFDVYLNVNAEPVEMSTLKQCLVDQIDNSVRFYNQIINIQNAINPDYWYHIGPGSVTAGMVKKSISSKEIGVLNSLNSINELN